MVDISAPTGNLYTRTQGRLCDPYGAEAFVGPWHGCAPSSCTFIQQLVSLCLRSLAQNKTVKVNDHSVCTCAENLKMCKLWGFCCVCVPTEKCIKESLLLSTLILSGISHKNSLLSFSSFVSVPLYGQGERLDFRHPARLLFQF